jgi:thiopurine S-methyltransferase
MTSGMNVAGAAYDFWNERWSGGQIGFHEGAPNVLLATHIARLEARKPKARILVPLAGKSLDLRWLAERGHEVVGVEFVATAVRDFFAEWNVEPERLEIGGAPAASANGVTLICADVLELPAEALGTFDVVYDRAALVALEPAARAPYVEVCRNALAEDGVVFLVTFAYDQSRAAGPPYSVDAALVHELYAQDSIELLETRSAPTSKRLTESGVPSFDESAYLIS